tara:strand:- start:5204 stop:5524 length:321 start_codon:yes stop_codon:yes gene_type:complete
LKNIFLIELSGNLVNSEILPIIKTCKEKIREGISENIMEIVLDFSKVEKVDTSAVVLVIEMERLVRNHFSLSPEGQRPKIVLSYLPANLSALLDIYSLSGSLCVHQ